LAKIVTMTEVETGVVDWVDLLKINSLLDLQQATEYAAMKKGGKGD
jgi:hypothetical protein